ncbi:MAG: efflux RND transporter periplasmic adaptor subunit [Gammaproteobacteria bacterium]|nr:efflux RND transporter periplasmic adaptor subunit [Gammaproteobacteria bacterium]MYE85720.1 efflux RND transporter periplasmic adaptor subunit [Gammaproteobacteria bacterium]MYF10589.1 efflux RND transporter periplasmic adaptor subunit [Gammaproteobacteria bacterium]
MRHPVKNCALPFALLVAALLFGGCGNNAEEVVAEQSVRPAKVIRVEAAGVVTAHEFVARVEAAQSIDVSFEVDGVLAELPVLEGQTIERGQLVAALDPTDFRLAVREAELQVELARQDWERKRRLLEQQGIAASLVEDARSMHELQQVRLAQRRESLAKSRITAPFDAYVAHRYVDNFVQVGAKDRVVRLNDLHELQVVAGVPEQLLVTVGTEQVVSIDAIFPFAPEQRFPLAFRENRGEADAVAQTYEVSFTMQRPAEYNILPGMTAAVRVILRPEAGAEASARIPASALISGPDKDFFVWLYDPETQAVRKQAVQVGPPAAHGVPVTSGLQGGEWIVATGANQLQEGMRVRPMNDAPGGS